MKNAKNGNKGWGGYSMSWNTCLANMRLLTLIPAMHAPITAAVTLMVPEQL